MSGFLLVFLINHIISAMRNTQGSGCFYNDQETRKWGGRIRERAGRYLAIPDKIDNQLYVLSRSVVSNILRPHGL